MYQQLSLFSFCVPQMIFKCISWWSLSPMRKQKDGTDNDSGWQERREMPFYPPQQHRLAWDSSSLEIFKEFSWDSPCSDWSTA